MLLKTYPCPTCKKPAKFDSTNLFRPFCSERCKMIDLGEWASENYKIAAEPVIDDEGDESEQP
jgi:endogenous inhibitor of DNA gyrase (YacG/DUF329 family)